MVANFSHCGFFFSEYRFLTQKGTIISLGAVVQRCQGHVSFQFHNFIIIFIFMFWNDTKGLYGEFQCVCVCLRARTHVYVWGLWTLPLTQFESLLGTSCSFSSCPLSLPPHPTSTLLIVLFILRLWLTLPVSCDNQMITPPYDHHSLLPFLPLSVTDRHTHTHWPHTIGQC